MKTGMIAPEKTKFKEQMIVFAGTTFIGGNIAKILSLVLIIAGDNNGLDKIEFIKTYPLFRGDKFADMGAMPKSHLAIVPPQEQCKPNDAD